MCVSGKGKLTEEEYKRARHVISEIERTRVAADALTEGKYQEFGKLMYESHYSLRLVPFLCALTHAISTNLLGMITK